MMATQARRGECGIGGRARDLLDRHGWTPEVSGVGALSLAEDGFDLDGSGPAPVAWGGVAVRPLLDDGKKFSDDDEDEDEDEDDLGESGLDDEDGEFDDDDEFDEDDDEFFDDEDEEDDVDADVDEDEEDDF